MKSTNPKLRRLRNTAFTGLMTLANEGTPRRWDYISLGSTDASVNWYDVATQTVVLRKYKTSDTYGAYSFRVTHPILVRLMKMLCKIAQVKQGKTLFEVMRPDDAFGNTVGVRVGPSMFRKLCITHFFSSSVRRTRAQALQLSVAMGHSILVQQRDYLSIMSQYRVLQAIDHDRAWPGYVRWSRERVAELYRLAIAYDCDIHLMQLHGSREFNVLHRAGQGIRLKMQNESYRLYSIGTPPENNPFVSIPLRNVHLEKLADLGITP